MALQRINALRKSQQVLKHIRFNRLKGLKDVTIDFTEKSMIAILGPNGIGKSTVLHAIACINNPVEIPSTTTNYRLSDFFTPTSHSNWNGSSFDVFQDYRLGPNTFVDHPTHFRKQQDRWTPKYSTRIERYVAFIGIRTCVPKIETESQKARIQFNTTNLNDAASNQVRILAGEVMNKVYASYNSHATGSNKLYIGVSVDGLNYSSLSMGAGEQRIFHILSELIKSPNHGLLVVDEIDLLLHQDALFRLLKIINRIAQQKSLQVIFTTHSQAILPLDFIAYRHLYNTPEKTLCFSQTKPDALQRLTGDQVRPLEVFVEDDLAFTLIKKIGSEEGLSRYIYIKKYGAAINCFTSVCGSILNNLENQENMLFVLDGDEYATEIAKRDRVSSVLIGTAPINDAQRQTAFDRITQFVIPAGMSPEAYFHRLIRQLDDQIVNQEQREILTVARQVVNPGDNHGFFWQIIQRMDWVKEVGLSKLVDLLAITDEWNAIKGNVKNWLDLKRDLVLEQ